MIQSRGLDHTQETICSRKPKIVVGPTLSGALVGIKSLGIKAQDTIRAFV